GLEGADPVGDRGQAAHVAELGGEGRHLIAIAAPAHAVDERALLGLAGLDAKRAHGVVRVTARTPTVVLTSSVSATVRSFPDKRSRVGRSGQATRFGLRQWPQLAWSVPNALAVVASPGMA